MNILIVNYEYPPIGAGAATASFQIASRLVKNGHRVSVITSAYKNLKGKSDENGVQVYRIPAIRKFQYRSNIKEMLSFAISAQRHAGKIIKEQGCEVAILFFTIPSGILGPFLKNRHHMPYIVSLRGGDVPGTERKLNLIHRIIKPLRHYILKNAVGIVANSSGLAKASTNTDPFPVKVIPNGVDTDFFSPSARTEKEDQIVNFLFVGRFQEQKNLFFLLDQFSNFIKNHPNVRLTLAGDGPLKQNLIKHASVLGIDKFIVWKPWTDRIGLKETYLTSDVLINPSLYEGMPNVVLEAMACGLPVIASNIMGNEELVHPGENGYLFDLKNPSGLQTCLHEICSDSKNRIQMGLKSREIVIKYYSWEKVTDSYAELIKLARNA